MNVERRQRISVPGPDVPIEDGVNVRPSPPPLPHRLPHGERYTLNINKVSNNPTYISYIFILDVYCSPCRAFLFSVVLSMIHVDVSSCINRLLVSFQLTPTN